MHHEREALELAGAVGDLLLLRHEELRAGHREVLLRKGRTCSLTSATHAGLKYTCMDIKLCEVLPRVRVMRVYLEYELC